MSENTIFVKRYDASDLDKFPVNENEIWRYSGYLGLKEDIDEELKKTLESVQKELEKEFKFQVCFRRTEITWDEDVPSLPFENDSKDLARCLKGSKEIIMFAATIGMGLDRVVAKYKRFSPVKALLMHAYGAERIESLCDYFCKEFSDELCKQGLGITSRFSPGYGDLNLEVQKEFFRLLDCSKQIGVSLGDSLLMTPSKSVTAVFGIKELSSDDFENKANHTKCDLCTKKDCEYKKTK